MTAKLLAYATYLPRYRLARAAIGAALTGAPRGSGARTVAGHDEDAVSMAVAATRALGAGIGDADNLYFATTSPPLLDKSCSLIVHAATGMHGRVFALDLTGLRSGFGALSVAAGTGGVAVLADLRTGRPGSAEESDGGDGAAAFLFGSGDAVAEVIGSVSVPLEVMDAWRAPGTGYALLGEDRLVHHVLARAVREIVAEAGTPVTALVSTLNRRLASSLRASIGAAGGADVQDAHRENTGYCGAADLGLLLAGALDTAKAGDTILVVSAGGGADALLLRVLKDGRRSPDRVGQEIGYHQYLTWRGALGREPARRPARPAVAPAPALRNSAWKYGLAGSQCSACAKVYLPPARVCACGAVDQARPFSVAGLTGTVVTQAADGVSDSPAPPATAALVDFGTTGRLLLELTDVPPAGIADGAEVEMTFRRTYVLDGVPNYFWKARPKR
ncbi:hydroxymethylglutaryl-CoA synthase [Nonomuraea sp. PA05]|uniref:hydroxymethylglutaryl-CoA synthase n=1 Tax=Nonomuraea sp. PA05 TaxID=2604466 RepID=UPI0011D4111D|nr:hydroxymethylglutaryl-CoA synthase [Nonomuraea sp. PA05]TYB57430.1 hydroxymethylglutaryl-CoA synthase [Nonomuraea sp. PA05]